MTSKNIIKIKGYSVKSENGYYFVYDKDGSNDDYPIIVSRDINFIREIIDKMVISNSQSVSTLLN
jgi:hypothetical protein